MSGRDVRRVAARASTTTHHDKQQQVTRLVLGAFEQGVQRIYLANEPFRINARAVENLPQRDRVELLDFPLTHSGADTASMMNAMWQEGCRTFIVLGGDGTNRMVALTHPDAVILPLSTGTNNVFPYMAEASVAGAAAGLAATGRLDAKQCCLRTKQIHVLHNGVHHAALVDAVLLKRDLLGNLMPFDPDNIAALVLARAEPASIGMSPVGGYVRPCHHDDDFGVAVTVGTPARYRPRVPISAGLYGDIDIREIAVVELGTTIAMKGPGILAFDGDRTLRLAADDRLDISIRRDGPWIIEPAAAMEAAVAAGLLAPPPPGPDR